MGESLCLQAASYCRDALRKGAGEAGFPLPLINLCQQLLPGDIGSPCVCFQRHSFPHSVSGSALPELLLVDLHFQHWGPSEDKDSVYKLPLASDELGI